MAKLITVELKNGLKKTVPEKIANMYVKLGGRIIGTQQKPKELGTKTKEITKPIELKAPEPIISRPEVPADTEPSPAPVDENPSADIEREDVSGNLMPERKTVKKTTAKKTTGKRKTAKK